MQIVHPNEFEGKSRPQLLANRLEQQQKEPGRAPGSPGSYFPVPLSPRQPRVLLLDHAFIELLEERRRLPERLPRRQLALAPRVHRARVIVGQRHVCLRTVQAGGSASPPGTRPRAACPVQGHRSCPSQPRYSRRRRGAAPCAARCASARERLQVVHDAQDHVHARRGRSLVFLDLEPGRLAVQACTERSECVAVGLAGQADGLAQACPE
jgi:hypothetical protein